MFHFISIVEVGFISGTKLEYLVIPRPSENNLKTYKGELSTLQNRWQSSNWQFVFILYLFYLRSQIALTGKIFDIYGHWSQHRFSFTWFMLIDGKKKYNRMHADHNEYHWKGIQWRLFELLSDSLAVFLLQDKHVIYVNCR